MVIPPCKGLIALDIDGTITAQKEIPKLMIDYLNSLYKKGWQFALITGRPFSWAYPTVSSLPFPLFFAVQNGALLFELPSKKLLNSYYLPKGSLSSMEQICQQLKTDFLIYSGYARQEACYYRLGHFSINEVSYFRQRAHFFKEKLVVTPSFQSLDSQHFLSFKCFAAKEKAYDLSMQMEKKLKLHAPAIKDPFNKEKFVIQATHPLAYKGEAVRHICRYFSLQGPVIAAGNDHNDLSLLQAATIKIAMEDAPIPLTSIADIIAPLASKAGLIDGLEQALNLI